MTLIREEQKVENNVKYKYEYYQRDDRVYIKVYEYCGCTNPWRLIREYYE